MYAGRSSFKQYLPMKPTKRGFKVWVRADAVNGYISEFEVYTGKGSGIACEELGLGENVVMSLTKHLQHKGYHIYCDNFFSSPILFDRLESVGLRACGTARPDRKEFPQSLLLLSKSLKRGEYKAYQRGNLVAYVWKDKKHVKMLSNIHKADQTSKVNRKMGDGSVIEVDCPYAITDYNKYMAGVDKSDQLRGYYHVRSKSLKNYKYIFWFLFDVSITNAFLLSRFSPTTQSKLSQAYKQFRLDLAHQLIGSYKSRKRQGRPGNTDVIPSQRPCSITTAHFPSFRKRKRCVYCKEYHYPSQRHESVWYCAECPGSPSLCLTGLTDGSNCFRLWHELNAHVESTSSSTDM